MTDDIEVRHGVVIVGDCDECGGMQCSPDGARALAANILAAAATAEANLAAIEAACADGHDWDSYTNSWHPWPDTKVTVRHCKRDGCDGRIEESGWVEFAGRLHFDAFGRQVSCYGPGCERCDNEEFGKALRMYMANAMEQMDAAAFRDKES